MSGKVQVIDRQFNFVFGDNAIDRLHFIDAQHLDVTPNHFEIAVTQFRPDVDVGNEPDILGLHDQREAWE
jgi:hypothetical protein